MKKTVQFIEKRVPCFQAGDLVMSQYKRLYVILEVKETDYKFISLQDRSITLVGEKDYEIKKGTIAEQPFMIFDVYHFKYIIK